MRNELCGLWNEEEWRKKKWGKIRWLDCFGAWNNEVRSEFSSLGRHITVFDEVQIHELRENMDMQCGSNNNENKKTLSIPAKKFAIKISVWYMAGRTIPCKMWTWIGTFEWEARNEKKRNLAQKNVEMKWLKTWMSSHFQLHRGCALISTFLFKYQQCCVPPHLSKHGKSEQNEHDNRDEQQQD